METGAFLVRRFSRLSFGRLTEGESMRTVHVRLLLVALGIGTFAAGALAGCGGDDNNTGGGDDAGSQGDTAVVGDGGGGGDDGGGGDGGTDSGPGVHANASDVSVYLGQIAQLDGSTSAPPGATLTWTVDTVPGGSAITTASVLNANGPKPTFTPDVVGDYVLKLTVTASGASDVKSVTVHAVAAQTFYIDYLQTYADGGTIDGGAYSTIYSVAINGGTPNPVACPIQSPASPSSTAVYSLYASGLSSSDQWEGPAGTEARAVTVAFEQYPDAGFAADLLAVTTGTSCNGASKPRILDTVPGPILGGASEVYAPAVPTLSPDGTRVLYVKSIAAVSATVSTIGFDGTNAHAITAYNVYPDGGAQTDAGMVYAGKLPPRWAPGGKIALASNIANNTRFQILLVDDAAAATPTMALGCDGTINHYDTLPNGDYLVEGSLKLADGGATTAGDLLVVHPNSLTKECEIVRDLTSLPAGSTVYGFTLSPDKGRVAYVVQDSSVDAGSGKDNAAIFVAAVDGSTPPARVPGIPYGAGGSQSYYHRPPRWVAGGSSLTFEIANGAIDAGVQPAYPSLATAPAGGGSMRVLAVADGPAHLILGFSACSVSHGTGSALMAFGSIAAFLGLVIRRRRRDS